MVPKIKICGVKDRANLQAARSCGVDWVGFVFFHQSPRYISLHDAANLLAYEDTSTLSAVGLFVRPTDEEIRACLDVVPLKILQIYDSDARIEQIKKRFAIDVWQATPLATNDALPMTSHADRLVVEPKAAPSMTRPGGNGLALDWQRLQGWYPPFRWMLAGGLTPENVQSALQLSGAEAIDVSSGVEVAPGKKSPELIQRFVDRARSTCLWR